MGEALKRYVEFWREAYESEKPWEKVQKEDGGWPPGLRELLGDQADLPPEPYYGYFHEPDAMKEDVLLLLYNPKNVNEPPHVKEHWHTFTRKRYLHWTVDKYQEECGYRDRRGAKRKQACTCHLSELRHKEGEGCQWRRRMYNQVRKDLIPQDQFLVHTMEYALFHSDKWNNLSDYHDWIADRPTTKLATDALVEMAKEGAVKYIFGFGAPWETILGKVEGLSKLPSVKATSKGGRGPRFTVFKAETGIPILIYIPSGQGMFLPSNPEAVRTMFSFFGTEPIPEVGEDPNDDQEKERELSNYIIDRFHESFPVGAFSFEGPRKDNFVYTHLARNGHPIWHIKTCNMRVRVYPVANEQVRTRIEIAFDNISARFSPQQKERLLAAMNRYADQEGYNRGGARYKAIYKEYTNNVSTVVEATADRLVAFMKDMDQLLDDM